MDFDTSLNDLKKDNLPIFYNFAQSKQTDFENGHEFVVRAIGNFHYKTTEHQPSSAMLDVFVINRHKVDNSYNYKIEKTEISWNDFPFVEIGCKITSKGMLVRLENDNDIYKKYFEDIELCIENTKEFKVLTKSDLKQEHPFLVDRIEAVIEMDKELFYKYDLDDKTVIIPAVEQVRHFYTQSEHRTLLNNILYPDATMRMCKSKPEQVEISDDGKEVYELFLTKNAKMDDSKEIFFFLYKEENGNLFSSVQANISTFGILDAPIPPNRVRFFARTFAYKNVYFVLKIHKSDMLTQLDPYSVKVHHPSANVNDDKDSEPINYENSNKLNNNIYIPADKQTNVDSSKYTKTNANVNIKSETEHARNGLPDNVGNMPTYKCQMDIKEIKNKSRKKRGGKKHFKV